MTTITAAMVKDLRERTGAGIMECKKALVAAEGDPESAVEAMRKSGQAKADKKSSRTAAEGAAMIATGSQGTAMVEINSETDFVARDASFLAFANAIAQHIASTGSTDITALANETMDNGQTVEATRQALVAKIGENIQIRRATIMSNQHQVGCYNHGGRIGVIVEIEGGNDELAKDIAMHIAASSPMVVNPDDVPADVVAKEKEIFIAQSESSGKPMEIIEKMIQGRLRKFLEEVSLTGQDFVKDPSQKVADLLKTQQATVISFTRYLVGEGIEKEATDFAKEVMEQAKGA